MPSRPRFTPSDAASNCRTSLRGRFPRDLDAVAERFVVDRVEPDQQPGPALIMIGLEEDAGLRLDQMRLGLQWAGEGDSASTRPLPTKPLPPPSAPACHTTAIST